MSTTTGENENTEVCRFFLRGTCRYGDNCRFIHNVTTMNNIKHQPLNTNDPNSWVLAPVFVPMQHQDQSTNMIKCDMEGACGGIGLVPSFSGHFAVPSTSTAYSNIPSTSTGIVASHKTYAEVTWGKTMTHKKKAELCPYEAYCAYGDLCIYTHGELCDMCGRYVLHPSDQDLRKKHTKECAIEFEKNMEISFAIQRSKGKSCGICFDVIMEKDERERRFGILPNCNHIFCLSCIRKWRQAKQFDAKTTRSCPECRISSDYVCPSPYYVDTKEDKEKLLQSYKQALNQKDCKYFKKGEGKCPFGNKCFYKHALANGQLVDVGRPKRNARKIRRSNEEILELFDIYLWDFVDGRNLFQRGFSFDSDDSDWTTDEDDEM